MKRTFTILSIMLSIPVFLISQQIENNGFEFWETVGTDLQEPVEWSSIKTSDNSTLNGLAPIIWEDSDDAHTGNHSIKLFNVSVLGIIASGTLTNGRAHADFNPELGYVFTDPADPQWNTPFTIRPDSLIGWYKFFPQGEDFGRVQALLHVGYAKIPEKVDSANWVGKADFFMEPGQDISTWTRFSAPFIYFDNRTPDYILFVLNSGNGTTPVEGSWALFDDITTVGNQQSVDDPKIIPGTIRYHNNSLYFNDFPTDFINLAQLEICNLMGQVLVNIPLQSDVVTLDPYLLEKGIYIVNLKSSKGMNTSKVYIY